MSRRYFDAHGQVDQNVTHGARQYRQFGPRAGRWGEDDRQLPVLPRLDAKRVPDELQVAGDFRSLAFDGRDDADFLAAPLLGPDAKPAGILQPAQSVEQGIELGIGRLQHAARNALVLDAVQRPHRHLQDDVRRVPGLDQFEDADGRDRPDQPLGEAVAAERRVGDRRAILIARAGAEYR